MEARGSRTGAIARATRYLDDGGFEADLGRRVTFRTESQKPEPPADLARYIDEEMIPLFRDMGFDCKVYSNPVVSGCPVLLANRMEDPDATTVLGYGHGDVILGLEDRWSKGAGAWKIAREGEHLYGRGTADNKGQHSINLAALACVLQERGKLGFNAKFLIEMGEENGSLGLREVIESNRGDFEADVFVASDGPRADPNRVTVSLGARGAENFDLVVELREGAHHSGNWGGLIADPATILTHAIATIVGPTGQILVDAWLPPKTSDAVKAALDGLEISAGPDAPEIDPDWGEPGMTPAEKVYGWNSFAVLAMTSGNPDNPVNAISPSARAHCQLRYFAGTDAQDILPALRRHLDANGFGVVEIRQPSAENAAGFGASRTEPDNPWVLEVLASVTRTTNEAPAIIPSMGGSICNDLFTDLLELPAIWLPHSYAGCSQHAPDEHLLMPIVRSGLQVMTGLYWDLGDKE